MTNSLKGCRQRPCQPERQETGSGSEPPVPAASLAFPVSGSSSLTCLIPFFLRIHEDCVGEHRRLFIGILVQPLMGCGKKKFSAERSLEMFLPNVLFSSLSRDIVVQGDLS